METLLENGLSNALMATVLALFAAALGSRCRRPALVHSLWLLVLLKLVTPPLVRVPIPWRIGQGAMPNDRTNDARAGQPEFELGVTARRPLGPSLALRASVTQPKSRGNTSPKRERGPLLAREADHRLRPLSTDPESPAHTSIAPTAWGVAIPSGSLPNETASAGVPEKLRIEPIWTPVVFWVWLAGAVLWLGRSGIRIVCFRRVLRYAAPAPEELQEQVQKSVARLGLGQCPELLLIPGVVSPMIWAFGRQARLLLPRDLLGHLDREQLATLLTHELAHLRRKDHWVRLLELVATVLYWWHPVLWWARRRMGEAEEEACDAWVVGTLPAATEAYATALLKTVDFLSEARPAVPPVASGIGRVQLLKRRLTMIMQGTTPKSFSVAGRMAVCALGAALLPLTPTLGQNDADQLPAETGEKQKQGKDKDKAQDVHTPDRAELEQLMRQIGRLLVEGELEEAKKLADVARKFRHRLSENSEEREPDRKRGEQARDRAREYRRELEALKRRTEQLREIDEQVQHARRQAEAQIREAQAEVRRARTEVKQVEDEGTNRKIDVGRVVEDALRGVNIGKIIEDALKGLDVDVDIDLRRVDIDVEKIRGAIPRVEVRVQKEGQRGKPRVQVHVQQDREAGKPPVQVRDIQLDFQKSDGGRGQYRVQVQVPRDSRHREQRSELIGPSSIPKRELERRVSQLESTLQKLLREIHEVRRALQAQSKEED